MQEDLLEVAPSALHLSAKAPFQPVASSKAVTFHLLCPHGLLDEARLFLQVFLMARSRTTLVKTFAVSTGKRECPAASRKSLKSVIQEVLLPYCHTCPCALHSLCMPGTSGSHINPQAPNPPFAAIHRVCRLLQPVGYQQLDYCHGLYGKSRLSSALLACAWASGGEQCVL